ncbi:MAG: tetratricopeptide repeat protein [Candidatus Magnetobacterium sp. LHC-1]|nr:tetratricopeptide repeat protein [Nitrospirota bacterium]
MIEIIKIIQKQVPMGSKVSFTLRNGSEKSGILVELGQGHITLDCNGSSATILPDMIGAWQVLADSPATALNISPLSEQPIISLKPPTSEALKMQFEINTRFQVNSQAAIIQIRSIEFTFIAGEFKDKKGIDVQQMWNRIKEKYKYAEKSNELSSKFGRIQPIILELKNLYEHFPNSITVKRSLGYMKWLSGNISEAIKFYKEAASSSNDPWDWYNVAALALKCQQDELSCHGLEQFFDKVSITENLEAWYVYAGLLKKHTYYRALYRLIGSASHSFSDEEFVIVLETCMYLLSTVEHETLAVELAQERLTGQSAAKLVQIALSHLNEQSSKDYALMVPEVNKKDSHNDVTDQPQGQANETHSSMVSEASDKDLSKYLVYQPKGYIYDYKSERGFGFIRGVDNEKYFFHRSAITEDDLLNQAQNMRSGREIPVVFETAEGPRGPLAIGITLYRTIDKMYSRATEYANDGEYNKAISQIKKVLELNPDYPSAKEDYEKWREYARISGVPSGSNPYARAKRVQMVEKDLEKAASLFLSAIIQGDNAQSAVKDLAALLGQQEKTEEAINILETYRRKIQDQQSVDNMLIGFYQKAEQFDKAIELSQKKLKQATTEAKKVHIHWQIANNYLRKKNYSEAEQSFRKVLQLQPDNKIAQRNIAICLFKQEHYDSAQKVLEKILSTVPDTQAADLLEAIKQAQTGQPPQIDDIIIETTLSDIPREISGFTKFFLDRCDYQGVRSDHVKQRNFDHSDILKLEQLATESRTIRPRGRAGYYLSAAKITSLLEDEDPNQFYKYLCRSFASTGDAIVMEGGSLDVAREFYCESLSVYDWDRSRSRKEKDAENALVRFLFSTIGPAQIPITPSIPPIDEALETILSSHPDRNKVFDAIAYLIFRSRHAANRILPPLYNKSSLQAIAIEYLKSKAIPIVSVKRLDDFVLLWNMLIRKKLDENRSISHEFRLLSKLELTTVSLERNIECVKELSSRLCFDLDQQRARQLQKILEMTLDLCKQTFFEEQERLCIQVDNHCQDLKREIEGSSTKFSVEEMYPVVEAVQEKVKIRLEALYESSTPQLTLRLPVESYTPGSNRLIEVQIAVSNRAGCSPAESLKLVIQGYKDTVQLDDSLRGGDQRILKVPLQVGEESLLSQAFSLQVYAQYRTRSGDTERAAVNNFSIRLDSEQQFEEIENPYAAYAEGGVVGNPDMFYGRDEMIANVAKALQTSRTQSKCVVIYGQKRAGKSSILHHLKTRLQLGSGLLVLDLGSIGSMIDEQSSTPFLYQILWGILKKLQYAIEDRVSNGYSSLELSFISDREFYDHPSPLALFKDVFDRFRRVASKSPDWCDVHPIVLIDEFSYIYGQITKGLIPESFMKNWKALLQENYFNAVLVGQDVMPKFKLRFPNEFGIMQDERVTYLRREDAVRLIDEPIRIGGRHGESRYRERAIEHVIALTAGSPFYIQILCNRLVEYMNRKRASLVTEADVEQVKEELLVGVNLLGVDKFDNMINSGDTSEDAISDEDALKVLTAIALNSRTGPCNRNSIVVETRTSVDVILEDLFKRDVVEREKGQYYSIRVGLFKEWLISH